MTVSARVPAANRARRWVDELPAEVVRERPVLAVGLVGGLVATNDLARVEERLGAIEELLVRPPSELVVAQPEELASVPARVEMYRAALALTAGDPAAAIHHADRSRAAAPRRRRPVPGRRLGARGPGLVGHR